MPYGIKLDERLQAVLNEIDADVFVDVGADHGKLTAAALLHGKAKTAIAADISPSSLKKAEALAAKYGLSDRMRCAVSDGLRGIGVNCDQIAIAGMGGYEIIKILNDVSYRGRAVLVAHQNIYELRCYLSQSYEVSKDYIVKCAGKFYAVVVVESLGKTEYCQSELLYGKNYPETDAYKEMLAARKKLCEKLFAAYDTPDAALIKKEYGVLINLCRSLKIL